MKHFGDITKIDGHNVPIVDVIVGGSPCQDLSIAGKRQGFNGERSSLFLDQIRIIKEMHDECRKSNQLIRPRFQVWENVPGCTSSNDGEDFRTVLEQTARIIDPDADIPRLAEGQLWPSVGCILADRWSIAWRVHDGQFWGKTIIDRRTGNIIKMGTPQRRRRMSLVADFRGQSAPEILFDRRSAFNQGQNAKFDFSIYEDSVAPLVSRGPNGVMANAVLRRLTPLECERLQGFPDGWTDIGEWVDSKGKKRQSTDSLRYAALGNSICLPFWEWLFSRIAKVIKKTTNNKPTMASLFDGIGGFPLAAARNGFEPVWASEIEEFQTAVTKKHFPEKEERKE